jgi:hypothetical protein
MFGVLIIAVRTYQDRYGYGVYSGPIGSAVFIITVTWVRRTVDHVGVEMVTMVSSLPLGCCG